MRLSGDLPSVSVIVPVRGEGTGPGPTLQTLRQIPSILEVIVVGAEDDRQPFPWAEVYGPRGRARQMNLGASRARGDALLFLHADSVVDEAAIEELRRALVRKPRSAFAFSLDYAERDWRLALLGRSGRWLSSWGRYALGDQGLGLSRDEFLRVGGYPDVEILEDWQLVRRFRSENRFHVLESRCQTSGRRFLARGVWRQLLSNIRLLMKYADGVPPKTLAREYEKTEARSQC